MMPGNGIPFSWTAGGFNLQAQEQVYVADFLLDVKSELSDPNLQKICDHDSRLIKNASIKFFELSNLTYQLQDSLYNHSIFKSIYETFQVLKDINVVLEDLIVIHEEIIAGPTD
jgi:hypothetical protein